MQVEQLALEMSLAAKPPNQLWGSGMPTLHVSTWRDNASSPSRLLRLVALVEEMGHAQPASLDFPAVEVSLSVRHMCPVCLCHVVRGLSLWGRPVVVQLCQEWVDKSV